MASGRISTLRPLSATSWEIVPAAWKAFVYYATLHMPMEPNGFYQFNPLQQLS
jgi:sulfoxide reductase catalytic subunit YedY